MYMYSKKYNKK